MSLLTVSLFACGDESDGGDATSTSASSSTSTGGGTGPKLPCDTSLFDPGAQGTVRVPTPEEFAKYVKAYDGEVYSMTGSTKGAATLASDGAFTMLGVAYSPTSLCFDTVIGAPDYGNTLYLNFAEGKADLWEKNGTFAGQLE
jgi:hypothetical protein